VRSGSGAKGRRKHPGRSRGGVRTRQWSGHGLWRDPVRRSYPWWRQPLWIY
jgi:hypothetical protein